MRAPKGFGKRYFTLASIQAHTSTVKLQSQISGIRELMILIFAPKSYDDDPPPEEELNVICNCIFQAKAKLVLCSTKLLGKPNCNCRYSNYRRSGISPPITT